jgi:hypothetical protein
MIDRYTDLIKQLAGLIRRIEADVRSKVRKRRLAIGRGRSPQAAVG